VAGNPRSPFRFRVVVALRQPNSCPDQALQGAVLKDGFEMLRMRETMRWTTLIRSEGSSGQGPWRS
jgi:hypothetical protein